MEKHQQQLFWSTCIGYLIFGLIFVSSVSANVIDQENEDDTSGLYNVVLNKFAPVWKALAKNVHGWRKIVTIAAIDCANDDNNHICREYEIMRFPNLKFFPVNTKTGFLGLEVQQNKDEELITQTLVVQLEKEQQEQRGGSDWPNLAPYRNNDIDTLWTGIPANIEYQFLIFDEPNSHLGAEVILDLYELNNVRIRRVTSENILLLDANKVNTYLSILAINKDQTQTTLKLDKLTRDGLRETILEFLKSKEISTGVKDISDNATYHKLIHSPKKMKPIKVEDKLYQLDLETTLRYTLNNEIPLSKHIEGEKLIALQTYLKVLAHYFPAYLPKMNTQSQKNGTY
ncbi:sulfhydryl oxidase 1-like [Phymastichus coffea]|uniref:sulfhydryl oxidase 1-like n=1 Tax=Phymastichus coffea TaxID=108790 RepID=UPI00273C5411|nr:sulfhydryl oxidase 1-like [Phymastichus coffea]